MIDLNNGALREAMVNAGAGQIVGMGAHSDAYQCIRAALAAAETVGYVLVPLKASEAMCVAADDAIAGYPGTDGYLTHDDRHSTWEAMIAARPSL